MYFLISDFVFQIFSNVLPVPSVAAHGVEVVLGGPVEEVFGSGGIGVAGGNVTGTAVDEFKRDGLSAGFFEGFDYFQDAMAPACSEVDDEWISFGCV